jgi:hypothetical protein
MSPGTPSSESVRKVCGSRKIVVDAAVNNINPFEALGGAHHHLSAMHHEIPAFHQLDAHLLGQEGVLEVCGIVYPRRQQHDLGGFLQRSKNRL